MNNTLIISSSQNPRIKLYKKLLTSKGIKTELHFLLFGSKIISDALSNNYDSCVELIQKTDQDTSQYAWAGQKVAVSNEIFEYLDIYGTNSPIMLCKLPVLEDWDPQKLPDGINIICSLGSPDNMGSFLRSALAFNVNEIIILKEACSPFLPKSVRSSSGACLNLKFKLGPSIKDLELLNLKHLIALDLSGTPIKHYMWPKSFYLLVGEEGMGVDSNIKCKKVTIPMTPKIESLNASHSLSIALYDINSKF